MSPTPACYRLRLVEYAVPDDVPVHHILLDNLPSGWASLETHTQTLGDAWLDQATALILVVPSVIMPIVGAPDRNALINHRHEGIDQIAIVAVTPFIFDPRLFHP
jgi:hypothetical protein